MNGKFSFDEQSLRRQILDACAELKNTDVYEQRHTFSDRMRARMSDTLRKERRYRIWQKTKMLLAVLLTLLVAAAMIYTYHNYDRIAAAVEEFWNTESEPPYGSTPYLEFSDELKQDYKVIYNLVRSYGGYDNDYDGTVILQNLNNGQRIEIDYAPTKLKETYDPDDGILVWGKPAEISGMNEKTLRWVWPYENKGIYFTLRSTLSEEELFRVVENIWVR
ncbi:MAG: hypothetical protein IJE90_05955 [Clostridia bacterium]|nr:hypothetical protein [Clostridia bacterium]